MMSRAEVEAMTAPVRGHGQGSPSARAGTVTLVSALLFSAAVAYAYVLSLSATFNPPTWVRAVGLMWLPLGLAGTSLGYAIARTGEGRTLGRIGVLIAIAGLAAFVGLVVALG
jgi:hypothetical protein